MIRRKTDSRNEIFLSALDLFTLLLFAFMGTTIRDDRVSGALQELVLPWAAPGANTRPHEPAKVVRVKWASGDAESAKMGALCEILVQLPEGQTPPPLDGVPCWPEAYTGSPRKNAELQRYKKQWERAVVDCDRAKRLEPCARLQIVLSEHGFAAALLVQDAPTTARK